MTNGRTARIAIAIARAELTILGPHPDVRRGPFFIRVARIFSHFFLGVHFSSPQKLTFLAVVTFKHPFKHQNSEVKI